MNSIQYQTLHEVYYGFVFNKNISIEFLVNKNKQYNYYFSDILHDL